MKKNIIIALSALLLVNSVNLTARIEPFLKTLGIYIPTAQHNDEPRNTKDKPRNTFDKDEPRNTKDEPRNTFDLEVWNFVKLAGQETLQSLIWAYMMGSSYSKIGATNLAKTTLLNLARRIAIESLAKKLIESDYKERVKWTVDSITSPMTTAYMLGYPLYSENQATLTGLYCLKGLIF